MSVDSSQNDSAVNVDEILARIRGSGVRLWSSDGRLFYRAIRGSLTSDQRQHLKVHKAAILRLLDERKLNDDRLGPLHAPLTYAQIAHINLYRLRSRPAIRQIASATRLLGPLDRNALQVSMAQMVLRHQSLRTRILLQEPVPVQEVSETVSDSLTILNLSSNSREQRERALYEQIDQLILKPINLSSGPLFESLLLVLGDHEHVLLAAMEHTISDGFSMQIFLRELAQLYEQVASGAAFTLSAVVTQYPEYAENQRSHWPSWWDLNHDYWNEHFATAGRLQFPRLALDAYTERRGWGTVPIALGGHEKLLLTEACRSLGTTLPMGMFVAFAALVLRWCNATQGVIQYVTDGRTSEDIVGTIGFFACMIYLDLHLRPNDTFSEFLTQVMERYSAALDHADQFYLEAQTERPEFSKNSAFNWVPQTALSDRIASNRNLLEWAPIEFEHPMLRSLDRDSEPVLLLYESNTSVSGGLIFPNSLFQTQDMERFGRNYLRFVDLLRTRPEERISQIMLL
jgi:hypothetical protein